MTRFDPSPDLFKSCLKPLLHHRRTRGLLMGICPRGCITSPTRHEEGGPGRVPIDTGDWAPKALVRLGPQGLGATGLRSLVGATGLKAQATEDEVYLATEQQIPDC
jgi:hypothetical protein